MKKSNIFVLAILMLTFNLVTAQDEKDSKFSLIGYGGIGYGILDNENAPNYNMNSNSGELLINYRLGEKFGLATGIGFNELSGDGFNAAGNFYHERALLKIPVLGTLESKISEKLKMVANFGFYGQTITKDEYQFVDGTAKDVYEGWNFGAQLGLGFTFQITNNFNAGIHYTGQSDLSSFEPKAQNVNNDQKLKSLNSVGIIMLVSL